MLTERFNAEHYADLHITEPETGKHQDQVKVLIEKMASSLDDTALKMLFISVQQNNIELSIKHAIKQYVAFSLLMRFELMKVTLFRVTGLIGSI